MDPHTNEIRQPSSSRHRRLFTPFDRSPSILSRYTLVVGAVGISTVLRTLLDPLLGLGVPFIFYYPTVVLCGWYGGLGPGLISSVLSVLVAWYVFIPTRFSFEINDPTAPAQLIAFCLASVLISVLAESLHRARRREQQRREQFRVTLASIGDAVIVTNAQGRVTFINQVAENLTGWTHDDVSERPIEEVFHIVNEETHQSVKNPAQRAIREGVITGLANHTVLIAKDGSMKPIDDSGAPIRDAEGHTIGAVLVFRDISKRRENEKQLAALQQQLQAHARSLESELTHLSRASTMGELVASIAHEVNQPLAAITTNSSTCLRWLASGKPDTAELREVLTDIAKDANRASDVIRRVRGLVRRQPLQRVQLDLNAVIQEVAALVGTEIVRRKIALQTDLLPNLPAVMGDQVQLQQVLVNLILNGAEAMESRPETSRKLIIRSSVAGSGEVLIAIRDSGIGLDTDNLDRIFDPFVTTKPQGLGMGLAISRSIIEAHGGKLSGMPNKDGGATFQLTLPADLESENRTPRG